MTSQPHASTVSLLDEIALALDGGSKSGWEDWHHLARKIGVRSEDCRKFGRLPTQSPTKELFQYLEVTRPQMTMKKLMETLHELERMDLLYYLNEQGLEGNVQLVRGQKIKNISIEIDSFFVGLRTRSLGSILFSCLLW